MSVVITEQCPSCGKEFGIDSEIYYWHLKIHLAKTELAQEEEKQHIFYRERRALAQLER